MIVKPHSGVELVDADGRPTAIWYSVLDSLVRDVNELQTTVDSLQTQIDSYHP